MTRHRRLLFVRGTREATREATLAALVERADDEVLWVGRDASRFVTVAPQRVRELLGRAFDAVVLDLHEGVDADWVGQSHGLVWGGGALVLRLPPAGIVPPHPALATYPYSASDVAARFWNRLEERITVHAAPLEHIGAAHRQARGTDEQRDVIDRLARIFTSSDPALAALLADRGRGKSSALGLALARSTEDAPLRVAVTAANEHAVVEVLRFAPRAPFVSPVALARGDAVYDVIVVDEAAQLPVPLLQRIVRHHPHARIAFASTVHGYEGTGRGFALRFLAWAEREGRPLSTLTLEAPIRWDAGDPLERFVFDVLALDAEPAGLGEEVEGNFSSREPASARDGGRLAGEAEKERLGSVLAAANGMSPGQCRSTDSTRKRRAHAAAGGTLEHVIFDRDRLASDERMLRELFGLLVHAHYRTTPSDLHRLLDAPNLAVHALLEGESVVAASLLAREGGLPIELAQDLARGRGRIRGHALADTLVCHANRPDAGAMSMVRSVRIAVHPSLRRRGLAKTLVEHVHQSYAPDLFGTLFGATPELVRFRRSVGYELVRVGISRGARTGEPAAVMVHPLSERARALVRDLRIELARNLPVQLALMDADGELRVEPELATALSAGLAPAPPLGEDEMRTALRSYLLGPRPYESAAFALEQFVRAHEEKLSGMDAQERAVLEQRVLRRHGWERVAAEAGYPSVPAAMRALRQAMRALAGAVDPSLPDEG